MSPARIILAARTLRGFGDGFATLLIPIYLSALGLGPGEVGIVSTAALLGSATLTLAVGLTGHRAPTRNLLLAASGLMLISGLAFGGVQSAVALASIAFVGTLNPSNGDVSVFVPLEQALLADAGEARNRTRRYALYNVSGTLAAAAGALLVGLLDPLAAHFETSRVDMARAGFALYGLLGIGAFLLYRRLPRERAADAPPPAPLGESKTIVWRLAALFSLDSFGGGFLVNSLLALWLFNRFDMSPAAAGAFFSWASVLTAFSQFASVWLARRIGLIQTMVFTHIPANLSVAAAAFAPNLQIVLVLLTIRALLSNMDTPARTAFVMAVVTPAERAAAAAVTNTPRSLAAALSPALAGWLYGMAVIAWPLAIGGAIKTAYDLILLAQFRRVSPTES